MPGEDTDPSAHHRRPISRFCLPADAKKPWLFIVCPAKTLIRLHRGTGQCEFLTDVQADLPLLSAHAIL